MEVFLNNLINGGFYCSCCILDAQGSILEIFMEGREQLGTSGLPQAWFKYFLLVPSSLKRVMISNPDCLGKKFAKSSNEIKYLFIIKILYYCGNIFTPIYATCWEFRRWTYCLMINL